MRAVRSAIFEAVTLPESLLVPFCGSLLYHFAPSIRDLECGAPALGDSFDGRPGVLLGQTGIDEDGKLFVDSPWLYASLSDSSCEAQLPPRPLSAAIRSRSAFAAASAFRRPSRQRLASRVRPSPPPPSLPFSALMKCCSASASFTRSMARRACSAFSASALAGRPLPWLRPLAFAAASSAISKPRSFCCCSPRPAGTWASSACSASCLRRLLEVLESRERTSPFSCGAAGERTPPSLGTKFLDAQRINPSISSDGEFVQFGISRALAQEDEFALLSTCQRFSLSSHSVSGVRISFCKCFEAVLPRGRGSCHLLGLPSTPPPDPFPFCPERSSSGRSCGPVRRRSCARPRWKCRAPATELPFRCGR